MKKTVFEIEIERNNVTPAQFLAYCRRRVDAKGGGRSDLDLDYFKRGNDLNFDVNHKALNDECYTELNCECEKSISRPYEMQTYSKWTNGAVYNEICEFDFDDEKTGHGYYYLLIINVTDEEEEPKSETESTTYINKIIRENACSIQTAEKLTEALHREGILHPDLALRFRPLFGDFDIVSTGWLKGNYNIQMTGWYLSPIDDPRKIPEYAESVTILYTTVKA